jgi:hypothetical protein
VESDALLTWLEARRPVPPAQLAARIRAEVAAEGGPAGTVAQRLARLALGVLERVARAPEGGRELAGDLLVADALLTYGFEAQAEADVTGLAALADVVARDGR